MRTEILLIILGMGLVTYIPRALPAVFIERMRFGKKAEKLLKLIPYTAMSALVFPSILLTDAQNPVIGIAGGTVAVISALLKMPVMLSVLLAIGTNMILYTFIF